MPSWWTIPNWERFARIKVPQTFPRLIRIPDEELAERYDKLGLEEVAAPNFVWLEDVIVANLDLLFPGVDVDDAYPFRVTRDADQEIEQDEASDLLMAMCLMVDPRKKKNFQHYCTQTLPKPFKPLSS